MSGFEEGQTWLEVIAVNACNVMCQRFERGPNGQNTRLVFQHVRDFMVRPWLADKITAFTKDI